MERTRAQGLRVGHAHLRWLNPFPNDLGEVLSRFSEVLIPELNHGQLVRLIRERFLLPAKSLAKIQGLPFKTSEIEAAIHEAASGN